MWHDPLHVGCNVCQLTLGHPSLSGGSTDGGPFPNWVSEVLTPPGLRGPVRRNTAYYGMILVRLRFRALLYTRPKTLNVTQFTNVTAQGEETPLHT